MWFRSLLASWKSAPSRNRCPQPRPAHRGTRLTLEQLEDRCLPSSYSAATVSDLIADINAANKAGGANTINLTAATGSSYVLTTVDNTQDGPTGLPVITGGHKADNLTIVGNGDTIFRSSLGTPSFRLLDVASGATLTLDNLTLQDGRLSGGAGVSAQGGALYNQGTVILSGVSVWGNGIVAAAAAGAKNHIVLASDAQGGGIWSAGSLTIENGSAIEYNSAVGGAGGGSTGGKGFGGGLYVAVGGVNISSTTIADNTVQGGSGYMGGDASGGGVYMAAGQVALAGVSLTNNSAEGGRGYDLLGDPTVSGNAFGGGISVVGGSVSLSSDTVEDNAADINPTDISGNPVGLGGGIYISTYGTVTLCSDTVEFNFTNNAGGGIYIEAGTVFIDTATVANTINNTDSGLNGSTASIDGSYILQNC